MKRELIFHKNMRYYCSTMYTVTRMRQIFKLATREVWWLREKEIIRYLYTTREIENWILFFVLEYYFSFLRERIKF